MGADVLHYRVVGSGPACLVVHGGPGLHHAPYRSLDPLARGRSLVYWDQRGHGRSAPLPDGPVEMALFADDAVALADRLGLGRFAVFGHSFGGWVAQELALRHPERVSRLVLAGTTPGQLGATESPDDDQGPPAPPEVAALMSRMPADDAELIEMYAQLAPHFTRGRGTERLGDALRPGLVSADSMRRVFDALGRWSSVDRLGAIACPTMVLAGRHDVFCSPQQHLRIVRRIPGAELVVFEASGHFVWLEEPAAFFPRVDAWLGTG
jgi:pimeloyl-ACP methyl ester carboxylesterase